MKTQTKRSDYDQGFIDGLNAYASWKDGIKYVGTTGTTLKQAVQDINLTWNYTPPKPEANDE